MIRPGLTVKLRPSTASVAHIEASLCQRRLQVVGRRLVVKARFAELLQLELRSTGPGEVAALHQVAAEWFAGRGYPVGEAASNAL